MFGAVLSALVSCFLAVSVSGSLEFVHNSSQNEDAHQPQQKHHDNGLTSGSQHPSDPIRIIGDGGTIVNNDIVLLLVQSMNTSTSMPVMLAPVAAAAATTAAVSTSMTGEKSHQPELRRLHRRRRRQTDNTDLMTDGPDTPDTPSSNSSFSSDEVRWSNINEQVDMVIPMVLAHLHKVGLTHLDLPDMQESLSVRPLFITYSAGLWLNNGLVYNLVGIKRSGDALMTYSDKSFICRFYLLIRSLQFDYDFLIKLMSIEGYGKVVGSLDDTVIYADLSINVEDTRLRLNDFRIVKFRNIQVQLSQRRFIQELSGVILSPITNLFRDRITTSISDGLKEQMQGVMDDFNGNDPLELRSFAKQMLAGLLNQM